MGARTNKTKNKRRVVITGIGLVTPIGIGTKENWENLLKGKSGIGKITKFDTSQFPVRIGGEIENFDPLNFIDKKEVKRMDPFIQYAMAATQLAIEESGLRITPDIADRVGVIVGSGIGGIGTIEETHKDLLEKGPRRVSPFFLTSVIINLASGQISIKYGAKGPNSATVTACTTGLHAIGDSFKIIQRGDADVMIAGGSEAPITPLGLAGFCAMRALSCRNNEPEKASRPFDAKRDGFVMGEGAGILILEELEFALKRNAPIYAEIVGYGMTGDAYHITAPCEDGDGAIRVMKRAIEDAGISEKEVNYINAHGTSTPLNDKVETLAIKKLFGEHAYKIPVSSTKSMTGHLLGAAGGVEAAYTVLTIKYQIIPPTINYEFPDPECDLDYVPNKSRKAEVIYALTNSFGFGGTNGSLLLKKFEE
ncbi:beta-ketoacyl-ACP synthase II [Candidatus Aminicenantes bacterium AC-335-A11]|jgi:3-oxoacyl-[acyl-carrier-protein] synthase II|nr:beta-ketoacyl-ACP synthase II [SCandidatus Aminicenantes bacterium Aminicenantia_JdfR_composite]MCP2597344.1 beta-ketoacyl-ACP synthase II [Candidatus Aminicenantes bacterium AC-335-G13]MCP2598116.1 beta-ketoacyl-ACP synthase II [Candidatus Aminicenantes bacterium AC-335-L06]MCP2618041.1 beta-ketoacyl-ACP synthase II [Candidatus Aminicenantes bacterium AC-335-A11]